MGSTEGIVPRRTRTPLNMKDGRPEVKTYLLASQAGFNQTGKLSSLEIRPDGINVVIDLPDGDYIILDLVYPENTERLFETGNQGPGVLTAAPAGEPQQTLEQKYADLRYAAGRVIRAYTMSDEQAGISGQDELGYAITDVLAGALMVLAAGETIL